MSRSTWLEIKSQNITTIGIQSLFNFKNNPISMPVWTGTLRALQELPSIPSSTNSCTDPAVKHRGILSHILYVPYIYHGPLRVKIAGSVRMPAICGMASLCLVLEWDVYYVERHWRSPSYASGIASRRILSHSPIRSSVRMDLF